jgi:hypothetical protein
MAAAHEILMGVLAGTAQVAHRLILRRGRMGFGQEPGTEQFRQLAARHADPS